MPAAKSLIGKKFGKLFVISLATDYTNHRKWVCLCDCGQEHTAIGAKLVSGHTKSCGCHKIEMARLRGRHWLSDTPTYWSWQHLVSRCNNARDPAFKNYGGRGIKVCERWLSFDAFLEDMGVKEVGKSIDRIDNNRGYEPENCRWADRKTQNNNTRANLIFTDKDGEVLSLSLLSEKHGVNYQKLKSRFYRNGRNHDLLIASL